MWRANSWTRDTFTPELQQHHEHGHCDYDQHGDEQEAPNPPHGRIAGRDGRRIDPHFQRIDGVLRVLQIDARFFAIDLDRFDLLAGNDQRRHLLHRIGGQRRRGARGRRLAGCDQLDRLLGLGQAGAGGIAIELDRRDLVAGRDLGLDIVEQLLQGWRIHGALRMSAFGLVGPRAEIPQHARAAAWIARRAGLAAVQDHGVREDRVLVGRDGSGQRRLDLVGILRIHQPQAVGDAEHVGVDGDGLLTEGVAAHHVGGLASDAGQA